MESTLCGDADAVAENIRKNHDLYSSANTYDSETDLFCVLLLSYWALLGKDYISLRELPTGKGFADILLIPRCPDQPGILAELKWDNTADSALRQFKEGRYTGSISSYPNVILVELTYEKDSCKEHYREHRCTIELLSQS